MHLLCIELTASAGPHNLDGVSYRGWPVKPLPEGVSDEGLGCRVLPTSPRVDFSQQLLPLDDRYTQLNYSRRVVLIQLLLFYQHKGLRSTGEASDLGLPRGSSPRRKHSR
jgi:hypothetical protein